MLSEYFYYIKSCKYGILGGLCCNFIYLHLGCEKWKEIGDFYICSLKMQKNCVCVDGGGGMIYFTVTHH